MVSDRVIYSNRAPGLPPRHIHFVVDDWESGPIERNLAIWMSCSRPDTLGNQLDYWRLLEQDGVEVVLEPCQEPIA